jgi:flagellum-specific peptidoglycan hydrolase FlgJ
MSRLAEIYKQEKKSGGGLGSAVTKRMGEKIDPRQMLDASGVIATMFPGLKPYSATKQKTPSATSSMPSISSGSGELSLISEATKITAKNTLAMPAMARDMHLVKQNIIKLVKSSGGKPQTKSGDFFNRQQARESAFEGKMGALGKLGGSIGASNLTSILGKKKDGQSPSSALFVKESKGLVPDVGDMLPSLLKGAALPAMLTPILAALGPLLLAGAGLALLGGLIFAVIKIAKAKGSFADEEESKRIDDIAKTGGLAGQKDEQDRRKKLSEYERTKLDIADYQKNMNEGQKLNEKQLEGFSKRGEDSAKAVDEYKKANNIGQTPAPTPAPASPAPTPAPAASATATAATPMPENKVTSGSGSPIMTGSGLPLTSGESMSPTKQTSTSASTGSNGEFKSKEDFLKVMYPLAVEASKQLGGIDPNALLTQWGFESAWGTKTSGKYNYFGIKADKSWTGDKKDVMTHEYLQGEKVTLPQPFRSYNSPEEAVNDYVKFLKGNKRYEKAGVFQAKTSGEFFGALQKAGYATDPNYASKLTSATEGTARRTAQIQPTPPATGTMVASASSAMAGARQTTGGGSVAIDNSQRTTVAAAPTAGRPASAYDKDIVDALMGSTYA